MGKPLVLETPLNEERIQKRSRNEASPSSVPLDEVYVKRQRLNPLSEQEHEETRSDIVYSTLVGETPTTSQTQALSRQQSTKVSSLKIASEPSQDLKEKYKEIKDRNEQLKAQTYSKYLKMAPTNQMRLMSTFDIKEGKMQMSFLKATIQQPKSMADYLNFFFEVFAKDIQPIDKIELHKKMGEMVYSTLTSKAIIAHQLKNSLSNTTTQLQLEKASYQAKDTRIKSLEELVIELGHNPKDVKVAEILINKKMKTLLHSEDN